MRLPWTRPRPQFKQEPFIVRDFEREAECTCGFTHYKVLGARYSIDGVEVSKGEWETELRALPAYQKLVDQR